MHEQEQTAVGRPLEYLRSEHPLRAHRRAADDPRSPSERALAGDSGALVLTMIWGLALAIVAVSGAYAAARWSPWPVYLIMAPAVLAIVWNLYENVAALLPNIY